MGENASETKDELLKRLRRIEGQVKGIQKMMAEDKNCCDIIIQIAAVRAAINKVGSLMLEKHSIECIENAVSSDEKGKAFTDLAKTIQSFMKFAD
ncbi:MAG: metal-sensitive transcriptional regulator [Bacillota bacterium]|nr:metal-sensitive transcriptional regulator [Bacillota bacterium]